MRLSRSCCQRTYFRIFSSSSPTMLTQYPCAQKCRTRVCHPEHFLDQRGIRGGREMSDLVIFRIKGLP